MTRIIEFDPVDTIVAGALGRPGERRFLVQAEHGDARVTVLVEKEQVAMLAAKVLQLLAEIDQAYPDETADLEGVEVPALREEPELFRARMMRLGFDAARGLVVLELFEEAAEELEDADLDDALPDDLGRVARLYATRAQMRGVAAVGAQAVASGRALCELCRLPMDPDGHDCPSRN